MCCILMILSSVIARLQKFSDVEFLKDRVKTQIWLSHELCLYAYNILTNSFEKYFTQNSSRVDLSRKIWSRARIAPPGSKLAATIGPRLPEMVACCALFRKHEQSKF